MFYLFLILLDPREINLISFVPLLLFSCAAVCSISVLINAIKKGPFLINPIELQEEIQPSYVSIQKSWPGYCGEKLGMARFFFLGGGGGADPETTGGQAETLLPTAI